MFTMAVVMLWMSSDVEHWNFLILALILLISGIAVEMFMEESNIPHSWTPPSEESVTEHLLMVLMMGGTLLISMTFWFVILGFMAREVVFTGLAGTMIGVTLLISLFFAVLILGDMVFRCGLAGFMIGKVVSIFGLLISPFFAAWILVPFFLPYVE